MPDSRVNNMSSFPTAYESEDSLSTGLIDSQNLHNADKNCHDVSDDKSNTDEGKLSTSASDGGLSSLERSPFSDVNNDGIRDGGAQEDDDVAKYRRVEY